MKKRRRWIGLIVLMTALVVILGIGFYRSVTHQESRPVDSGSPTGQPSPPG